MWWWNQVIVPFTPLPLLLLPFEAQARGEQNIRKLKILVLHPEKPFPKILSIQLSYQTPVIHRTRHPYFKVNRNFSTLQRPQWHSWIWKCLVFQIKAPFFSSKVKPQSYCKHSSYFCGLQPTSCFHDIAYLISWNWAKLYLGMRSSKATRPTLLLISNMILLRTRVSVSLSVKLLPESQRENRLCWILKLKAANGGSAIEGKMALWYVINVHAIFLPGPFMHMINDCPYFYFYWVNGDATWKDRHQILPERVMQIKCNSWISSQRPTP